MKCPSSGNRRFLSSEHADLNLKGFVLGLVERPFLSNYTWSGKTKKSFNVEKFAFKDLTNIAKLLIDLVKTKARDYDKTRYESHMINKVLKYAYR